MFGGKICPGYYYCIIHVSKTELQQAAILHPNLHRALPNPATNSRSILYTHTERHTQALALSLFDLQFNAIVDAPVDLLPHRRLQEAPSGLNDAHVEASTPQFGRPEGILTSIRRSAEMTWNSKAHTAAAESRGEGGKEKRKERGRRRRRQQSGRKFSRRSVHAKQSKRGKECLLAVSR